MLLLVSTVASRAHFFGDEEHVVGKQLTELRSLRGKNADVIMHLMTKSREEQASYLRNVESFQNSRRLLQNQARTMLDTLSMDALDRLINKTRESMTHS